jgi:UDPglucose 6-dehydrogenase
MAWANRGEEGLHADPCGASVDVRHGRGGRHAVVRDRTRGSRSCRRRGIIAIGTPSRRGDGHADLSYVYDATREIAAALDQPCPSAPAMRSSLSSTRRGRTPMSLWYRTPNFCARGAAIHDFKHPDRIVVGTDDERAKKVVDEIYRPLDLKSGTPSLHYPAHRRTHQIRGQCVPGDQDHFHQ